MFELLTNIHIVLIQRFLTNLPKTIIFTLRIVVNLLSLAMGLPKRYGHAFRFWSITRKSLILGYVFVDKSILIMHIPVRDRTISKPLGLSWNYIPPFGKCYSRPVWVDQVCGKFDDVSKSMGQLARANENV